MIWLVTLMTANRSRPSAKALTVLGVLAVSLVGNFFVLGFWASRWLADDPAPLAAESTTDDVDAALDDSEMRQAVGALWRRGLSPRVFIRDLPEPHRAQARQTLRSQGVRALPLVRDLARARRGVAAALAADSYSESDAQAAFARLAEADARLRAASYVLIVQILSDLPDDVRRDAVQRMLADGVRSEGNGARVGDGRRGPLLRDRLERRRQRQGEPTDAPTPPNGGGQRP